MTQGMKGIFAQPIFNQCFFQMFIDRAAIGRATELISEYKIKPVLLKRASGHTLEDQEFLIHTSRRKRQRNIQDDE